MLKVLKIVADICSIFCLYKRELYSVRLFSCDGTDDMEKSILVCGMPSDAGDHDIIAIFESKRNGGGQVDGISRLADDTVVVTFASKDGKNSKST